MVSDQSLTDPGYLGEQGLIPDWPGNSVCPPQPMVAQTRSLLDQYQNNGGSYQEVVMIDVGHSPFIERPKEFLALLVDFVGVGENHISNIPAS